MPRGAWVCLLTAGGRDRLRGNRRILGRVGVDGAADGERQDHPGSGQGDEKSVRSRGRRYGDGLGLHRYGVQVMVSKVPPAIT